jgi:hypothetical protein
MVAWARAVEDRKDLALTPVGVTLLGPFGIKLGERSAGPWPRPSAKRLWEILMCGPDHRVGREVVQEMLFPNLDPAASAKALSNAISLARQALSPLGEDAPSLLQADRANVWVTDHVLLEIDYEDTRGCSAPAWLWSPVQTETPRCRWHCMRTLRCSQTSPAPGQRQLAV